MTLVRPKPRPCRWPCFATITGRRRSSVARCRGVGCDRTKMFRPAALLPADHCSRASTGQPAPGALKAFMLLTEAPAGSSTRCPPNLNCHNHNQHAGRPCFSLAILIERLTAAPRCDICPARNGPSHISSQAIHVHANCSPLHQSTTAELSCARCNQSDRRVMRTTIVCFGVHFAPVSIER